jgi:Tfp pilus assembly protein PilO
VVAKVRDSVSKQVVQKSDMERFNLKKLNDMEVKDQYQVKISNRFVALENLEVDYVDISRAWESVRESKSFRHRV